MLWVTRKNSYNMESHVRCDHLTVLAHLQTKRSLLDFWFKEIASRHPTKVATCQGVGLRRQIIKIRSTIQLDKKTLSGVLIIEQNLLDVYLLRSTGHCGNDFVTHPGRFCHPFQLRSKCLIGIAMRSLPGGEGICSPDRCD